MEVKRQYAYFSAAIREGAKLKPQGFGIPEERGSERYTTSCAMQAGWEALGIHCHWADEDLLYELYPYMRTAVARGTSTTLTSLFNHCWHMNDEGVAREAVADWLYAEEEKLGFVTVLETEAHKIPEAGLGDSVVTEARRFVPVLTKRF